MLYFGTNQGLSDSFVSFSNMALGTGYGEIIGGFVYLNPMGFSGKKSGIKNPKTIPKMKNKRKRRFKKSLWLGIKV